MKPNILIKDIAVCTNCISKDCSFRDAVIKDSFYGLRSETTVCPVGLLLDGPEDLLKEENGNYYISDDKCINCGLCQLGCRRNENLDCLIDDYESDDFANLSDLQHRAIICSYLHYLIGFSANTNRNRSLQFDGYVCSPSGNDAFVEIDYADDSLECVRRILGDILLYSKKKVNAGLVVLSTLPKQGSRDVYDVLSKMSKFPTTQDVTIYFSTYRLLRYLALNFQYGEFELQDMLYSPLTESVEDYINKISSYSANVEQCKARIARLMNL
jgi:NAD-dependent dihydropyrimidine dehydrogenase PreA subunit